MLRRRLPTAQPWDSLLEALDAVNLYSERRVSLHRVPLSGRVQTLNLHSFGRKGCHDIGQVGGPAPAVERKIFVERHAIWEGGVVDRK